MTDRQYLRAHPAQTWEQVRQACAGTESVWVDIDRIGEGPVPEAPPLTTHLWAWTNERLLRVRLDRDRFWVVELTPEAGDEPVDVVGPVTLQPWGEHAERRPAFVAFEAHPVTVGEATPIVFYREAGA